MKGFFRRLFIILKGGVPWLDGNQEPSLISKNSDSKNIFIDFTNEEQIKRDALFDEMANKLISDELDKIKKAKRVEKLKDNLLNMTVEERIKFIKEIPRDITQGSFDLYINYLERIQKEQ